VRDGGASRWPPWYGPAGLVLGLVLGVIGGIIVVAVVHERGGNVNNLSPGATDAATVIQDLGFVGAAVILAAQVGPVRAGSFGLLAPASLRRALGLVIGAAVLFVVFSFAWFNLLGSSGNETDLVKEIGGDSGTLGVLAACAVTTVVAPICEELLFRGFVFRALANWRGTWPAAIATGLLFGAVHGLSAPAVDLAPLAFLGVALCLVYAWSGSLYPCIALHVVNNAIALGNDENWVWRTVELVFGGLAVVTLVLAAVRLASARWAPATD